MYESRDICFLAVAPKVPVHLHKRIVITISPSYDYKTDSGEK